MISLTTIIYLLLIHWVADFILQSRWMATNKSSSNSILAAHVFVYSIPFFVFGSALFVVLNFVLHFMVDWVSSRLTSKLWEKKNIHGFFAVVGLDQVLHLTCLFSTYIWIFGA